ncbi:hypothetical protein FHS95_000109 [Sphingomonas naasensis]|uniref:Lipoprotein n=1 Tax=Sphingomonas naasensis TaxID=1344951 RepID=A0A4S1WQU6_9SPHN|nr:hypothetical protein [Sphingomonas naasensis]NIJ18440.1 hypothetical protein [Sphingomonas naasensis]TGX45704.1 hypothetical protein E5A74_00540 [Sphingomonas naasensis]
MNRLSASSWAIPLLLLTPVAAAREDNPGTVSAAVEARLSGLPDTLAGLPRVDGGYDKPMAAYRGRGVLGPVIAIAFSDAAGRADWRRLADLGRSSASQAELLDTLFEGRFDMASHADARTYFGDYLTRQGIKQSWIAEYGGVRMTILATIYRAEDRSRIFDAIRRDLLGGITMEKVAPADAN